MSWVRTRRLRPSAGHTPGRALPSDVELMPQCNGCNKRNAGVKKRDGCVTKCAVSHPRGVPHPLCATQPFKEVWLRLRGTPCACVMHPQGTKGQKGSRCALCPSFRSGQKASDTYGPLHFAVKSLKDEFRKSQVFVKFTFKAAIEVWAPRRTPVPDATIHCRGFLRTTACAQLYANTPLTPIRQRVINVGVLQPEVGATGPRMLFHTCGQHCTWSSRAVPKNPNFFCVKDSPKDYPPPTTNRQPPPTASILFLWSCVHALTVKQRASQCTFASVGVTNSFLFFPLRTALLAGNIVPRFVISVRQGQPDECMPSATW